MNTLKNSWNRILKDLTDADPSNVPDIECTPETDLPSPDPEGVETWISEDIPTADELTDAVIVESILNPEPEIVEELTESEDEDPEPVYNLPEQVEASETLLRSLMRSDEFTSSDSLYFASLIDRLKRRLQRTVKQTSITRFFRRATD